MDERTERHERPERSAPPDRPGRTTRRRSRRRAAAAAGLTIGAASIFVFGGVSGGLAGGDGDEPVEHPARLGTSTPTKVALDHLQSLAVATAPVGFAGSDRPLELVVDSTARTEHAAVTHVYVQQRLDGVDVVGATANVAVTDDGVVAHDPNSLVGPDLAAASDLSDLVDAGAGAIVDPVAAVAAALVALDVTPSEPLAAVGPPRGSERRQLVSDGGVASGAIEARLVHVPVDKELVLGWEVRVDLLGGDHLQLTVAVQDGRELDRQSYTISHTYVPAEEVFGEEVFGEEMFAEEVFGDGLDPIDDPLVVRTTGAGRPEPARTGATGDLTDGSSYRVFPLPIEAPAFGNPSVVSDPADPAASPFGWHDTDGVAGAESTLTTGNNVDAYLDLDSDNLADVGSRPDGGVGLDFDVVYDAGAAPDEGDNPLADVINLFYANNWAHDFFHAYGFDEASGNFQQNNYGNGGAGGDPVRAEALDGYGLSSPNTNNANFATPPDGFPGRMQMYGFTFSDPHRSSSLDNGIVLHEYGHGWSVRLTGGRTNVTCLTNTEQMGEGWSDYAALVATMRPGDAGTDARGIGAWAIGQTDTGRGIRAYPYSTDLGVDPRTYDEIRSSSVPHGLGSTWAAMLWEMTWALIDQHGFDPDVVHGTGGNNLAMQLVSDGLKLQPCRPGFVDGRDAIIQADRLGNGGANECLIWEAFAKRGLGWGADQGSSDSRSDGIESFELPPFCPLDLRVDVPSGLLSSGDTATFALTVDHRGVTREDALVVVDELGPGLELVLGSTACDRTTGIDETTADVTIRLERLDPGDRLSCTYRVEVTGAAAPAVTVLSAGFDETLEPFAIFRDDGGVDWTTSSSDAGTGTGSAYATNPSTSGGVGDDTSDQSLITPTMTIAPCSTLSFSHRFDTESFYDGGVVEIRQGSGSWIDLGSDIIVGGYTQTIASLATTNSAISGRRAFAGDSGGFVSTVVDLADHVGDAAMVRFRYVSDFSVGSAGWWIDDVVVERAAGTSHTARLSSGGGTDASTSSCLAVEGDVVAPTTTAPVPTTEQPTPPTTTGPPEEGPTEPPNDAPTDDPARTTPSPPPIEGGGIDPELLEAASRLGSG